MDLTGKLGFSPKTSEMILEVELPEGAKPDFGIALSNSKGEVYQVGFDAAKNEFYSDRTKAGPSGFSNKFATKRHVAPRASDDKTIRLHLFFDVASCELFADGGDVVMTDIFFPGEDFSKVSLFSSNGEVNVKNARFYSIKRAMGE